MNEQSAEVEPFDARIFTPRDSALAVLRAVADCLTVGVAVFGPFGVVLGVVGAMAAELSYAAAGAVLCVLGVACGIASRRVARSIRRLTGARA